MNVLFYLVEFPLETSRLVGGPVKHLHGLAQGLAAQGATVTILSDAEPGRCEQCPGGYTVRGFGRPPPLRPFAVSESLASFLAATPRPALVVVLGIFNPRAYAVARLARDVGLPYVVSPLVPYCPAAFLKSWLKKWPYWFLVERRLLKHAAAVQYCTAAHAGFLSDRGLEIPAFGLPNGCFAEDAPPLEQLCWRQEGPARLVFLGRLERIQKGLDLFLEAVAGLRRRWDLQVVMKGPDAGSRALLERLIRDLGLTGCVRLEEAEYGRSAELLAEHDVVCLPSRFEGFTTVAIEAMLGARVLLTSELDGCSEHVRLSGCGRVVAPEARRIAEGLEALLRDRPRWREMGLRGRAHALEHLQWSAIATRAAADYERVLKTAAVGRAGEAGQSD